MVLSNTFCCEPDIGIALVCGIIYLRGVRYLDEQDRQGRIHWHEAFYEALQVELHEQKDSLQFENERLLSKEALKMDVLIIKKEKDVEIKKNIGRIFKTHNIFEYKSETDYLSIYDYYKVLGYALIYASFEKAYIEDITVSFVVTKHPRQLFKYLEGARNLKIENVEDGIYYVVGDTVSIQILEQKKLHSSDNFFLRNLGSNISVDNLISFLHKWKNQEILSDKNKLIETMVLANKETFKEAMNMSAVMKELFLEAAEKNGWLKEEKIELAKKMLQKNESSEKIVDYTGLSLETIKKIQESV